MSFPEWREVAAGTWMYGGSVPMKVKIFAVPAELSATRYVEGPDGIEQIDPALPIPMAPDGWVYRVDTGPEFPTLTEATAWLDGQPYGPISWVFCSDHHPRKV
jgi:hypothetical protein